MLIGSFAFANTSEVKSTTNLLVKEVNLTSLNTKSVEDLKVSCTVHVVSGNYDVTITVSCDCTRGAACKTAYSIASIGL